MKKSFKITIISVVSALLLASIGTFYLVKKDFSDICKKTPDQISRIENDSNPYVSLRTVVGKPGFSAFFDYINVDYRRCLPRVFYPNHAKVVYSVYFEEANNKYLFYITKKGKIYLGFVDGARFGFYCSVDSGYDYFTWNGDAG